MTDLTNSKIWLDVDGVQADLVTAYLGLLNLLTGRVNRHEDVTSFQFNECVASVEEDNEVWQLIDLSPGFVRNLAWYDGAEYGVAKLRQRGSVRALTSPHFGPTWMPERAQWLVARGYTKKGVFFCSQKEDVPGDFLVEDCLANADAWQDAHPRGLAILLDAPWNQGPTISKRVNGWEGVVQAVKSRQFSMAYSRAA